MQASKICIGWFKSKLTVDEGEEGQTKVNNFSEEKTRMVFDDSIYITSFT